MKWFTFWRTLCLWLVVQASISGAELKNTCRISFERKDIVAFIGGADVAAAQTTGHTESLLTALFPGTLFRNFGWEGDTVYAQPRDYGFPPLKHHLKQHGATVMFLQFGRMESLDGLSRLGDFEKAYQGLIDELKPLKGKIILVTPPPFEKTNGAFPDLSRRNEELKEYCEAIRNLAEKNSLLVIDLFSEISKVVDLEELASMKAQRLTENGVQLNNVGYAIQALAFVRQLKCSELPKLPLPKTNGTWNDTALEKLRLAIIEKNQLWTYYWRPHNWAFLGGDRITQPSSRDHLNPAVRWFPAEMEKYVPLIQEREKQIQQLATPSLQKQQ